MEGVGNIEARRALHAHQHRTRHDAVPDVQLLDAGDADDGPHVLVVQPVAHVDVQPQPHRAGGRRAELLQLALDVRAPRFGVARGLELDGVGPEPRARVHLRRVRVDEQRDVHARGLQAVDGPADARDVGRHVQPYRAVSQNL